MDQIGDIPENLYREPLEAIYADHFRALMVCRMLDGLGAQEQPKLVECLTGIRHFLEHDLPIHMADEEQDLFPLLRRRCRPEDEVDNLLALLSEEHARNADLATAIIQDLAELRTKGGPARREKLIVEATLFKELQRRHLAWENSVLLPLARSRLNAKDFEVLGRHMAARHGVIYPE